MLTHTPVSIRILWIVALFTALGGLPACRQPSPHIDNVDSKKIQPGSTIKLDGSNFGKDSSELAVKVGTYDASVAAVTPESIRVELPKKLPAGDYDVIVTNVKSGQSSPPLSLKVIEKVKIPAGTRLHVRTDERISSDKNLVGDTFRLILETPILSNNRIFAPPGSSVTGRVILAKEPGRVKGRAEIGFTLIELRRPGSEQFFQLVTDDFSSQAKSTTKRDATTIGITTGLGAVIGAIAGGGKGAAIGAAAGAGTGTGVVLLTKGDQVMIPANAGFTFILQQPIEAEITEPLPPAQSP